MAGLKGISRLPRDTVRARRNASTLAADFLKVLGPGLTMDGDGLLTIDLAAVPGLEFTSDKLRVKIQDPIKREAAGIGLTLKVTPGLEIDSGLGILLDPTEPGLQLTSGLKVLLAATPGLELSTGLTAKLKTDGGVLKDADGLYIDTATTTKRAGLLQSAARADSGQSTITLSGVTDPADNPVDADALRDDLVANTIPDLKTRDGELETAVEILAGEFNDLLAKLRTAGILAT